MTVQYDPLIVARNIPIKGYTKAEVFNRVSRMMDEGDWEILHPIKKYMNSYENLVYFISVRRKNE